GRKTAARRSCMTRWPTWFESSVWITPSTPVAIAIAIIPPAFHDSAAVSLRPIASRTCLSRNAGITPSPAETTMRSSTPPRRSLYGVKSGPIRRRFARRTAGSAARSGGESAAWKNMPIGFRVRLEAVQDGKARVGVQTGRGKQRGADVAREKRVPAAAVRGRDPLGLCEGMHGKAAGAFEPTLVAGARECLQEPE